VYRAYNVYPAFWRDRLYLWYSVSLWSLSSGRISGRGPIGISVFEDKRDSNTFNFQFFVMLATCLAVKSTILRVRRILSGTYTNKIRGGGHSRCRGGFIIYIYINKLHEPQPPPLVFILCSRSMTSKVRQWSECLYTTTYRVCGHADRNLWLVYIMFSMTIAARWPTEVQYFFFGSTRFRFAVYYYYKQCTLYYYILLFNSNTKYFVLVE